METWKVIKEYNIKDFSHVWMNTTHLQHPTITPFGTGSINILVGVRDAENRSRIRRFSIDKKFNISSIEREPLLELGGLGTFDEYGQIPSCIEIGPTANRLWYIGITRGTVPYKNSIGTARIEKFEDYKYKRNNSPIISQSNNIPYFATSPWFQSRDSLLFVTGTGYIEEEGNLDSQYALAIADYHSRKCIVDTSDLRVMLLPDEHRAIARPVTYKDRLYFSARSNKHDYSIKVLLNGQWESQNDVVFEGLPDSAKEMQCYPMPFEFDGKDYMLFNGNNYGKNSLLLAIKCSEGSLT